jgi:hypothetical protein
MINRNNLNSSNLNNWNIQKLVYAFLSGSTCLITSLVSGTPANIVSGVFSILSYSAGLYCGCTAYKQCKNNRVESDEPPKYEDATKGPNKAGIEQPMSYEKYMEYERGQQGVGSNGCGI